MRTNSDFHQIESEQGATFNIRLVQLFVAQGVYRIHLGSAARWNPNGEQSHGAQDERNADKHDRVPGFDPEKQVRNQAGESECRCDSYQHSYERQPHALKDDQVADIDDISTQSHANAEFLPSL